MHDSFHKIVSSYCIQTRGAVCSRKRYLYGEGAEIRQINRRDGSLIVSFAGRCHCFASLSTSEPVRYPLVYEKAREEARERLPSHCKEERGCRFRYADALQPPLAVSGSCCPS